MAASRLCSIPDCGKKYRSLGYCNAHYRRWRRHGDPLVGRTDTGEPARYFNEVVVNYDGVECLFWPFTKDQDGYGLMSLDGRTAKVSRVLCACVNGPPPTPKHHAAHSCGKGHLACVTKGHLSWKTPAANQADRIEHGTAWRGETHPNSKLTDEQVRTIRADPRSERVIARERGLAPSTVGGVKRRTSWPHVQ